MWKREAGWFALACVTVASLLILGNSYWRSHVQQEATEFQVPGPDFSKVSAAWVGREACVECHAAADSAWTGSDHDLAMQIPSAETITANFNNSSFTHFGITTTFFMSDNKYMVRTDGPDGSLTIFEVAYVFGHFPIEQYLIRFPDGRLQALNICWSTTSEQDGGQRWFHLYPNDETASSDLFHWTGMLQNWNFMCAECHSTNLQRTYNPQENTYNTTWSELDVSCEACHGPASRHITWERAQAQGLRPQDFSGSRGLVVNLKSPDQGEWIFEEGKTTAVRTEPLASRVEVQSCARCHARRGPLTDQYKYNRPFLDDFRLTLLNENLYYADGQNLDEVYVYGSFLQSKMHSAGVTCSDCHDHHSMQTKGEGNLVCARCHRPDIFDTPDHHFHQMGQGGDSCLDCHMQSRKVMVVDGRRDHSFRIPRPDLSLELGTPNACSDCHDDKPVQWSQDAVIKWYGDDRLQGPHYALALHAGRVGSPDALDRLRALLLVKDQPDIAKATALSLIPRFAPAAEVPEVVQALNHSNPLVRSAAVRSLATSNPQHQLALALPMVKDEVLDVRVAAAGIISGYNHPIVNEALDAAISEAHNIWRTYHRAILDRPESLLQLANFNILQEKFSKAEANFEAALLLESKYSPTYVNYADFLRRQQRPSEAEALLKEGLVKATMPADIHHSLGLLFVSQREMPQALEQLKLAVLQPNSLARYAYVYAVALYDSGQADEGLTVLEESLVNHPWDWDSLLALTLYSLEQKQPSRALDSAQKLIQMAPTDAGAQELLEKVKVALEN